jgi:hypothetical protein
MLQEKTIQFMGYTVSLYEQENSSDLGLAVYPTERVDSETPCVDISVSKELQISPTGD